METAFWIVLLLILVGVFAYVFNKCGGDGTGCCLGCLSVIIVFFGIVWLWEFSVGKYKQLVAWREERLNETRRQEEMARLAEQERAQVAEARRREEERNEKIRTFALREAPEIWSAYQALQSDIQVQNSKIEELRKTLESFGRDTDEDADFKRICDLRDDMSRSHAALRRKLEEAYIAWRKYEASPSRRDYQELHRKAIEDGIREADAASAKFKEMRMRK